MRMLATFTFIPLGLATGALVAMAAARTNPTASNCPPLPPLSAVAKPELLIADVARGGRRSALGTAWYATSDRVMGGISEGKSGVDDSAGCPAMRLRGQVRLENHGGFLMLGLPLGDDVPLDTRQYRAVRIVVRGNGERYTLSLRTPDTRTPTQFYDADFSAGPQWEVVELPLASFAPRDLDRPLDRTKVMELWFVAKGRAFDADFAIARVSLVP